MDAEQAAYANGFDAGRDSVEDDLHALRERVAALDEAVALMHRMGADDARDEWGQRVVLPELETDIAAFLARRALTAPANPTNADGR